MFIKPDSRVNKKNIRKIWPEVLPVLYGLLSHDTKQENIIRQLASHDYKSEIKDALWEMNGSPRFSVNPNQLIPNQIIDILKGPNAVFETSVLH